MRTSALALVLRSFLVQSGDLARRDVVAGANDSQGPVLNAVLEHRTAIDDVTRNKRDVDGDSMVWTLVAAIAIAGVLPAAPTTARDDSVWFWFSTCGGPMMTVEVKFDGASLSKTSVPVCRAPRGSAASQGQAGRTDFVFTAPRGITWTGYRDAADRTRAGERIEGDLWQAGGEPDALLIGISFMTTDRILINTIHIAHPTRRDETAIARGLVVLTYPTPPARQGQ